MTIISAADGPPPVPPASLATATEEERLAWVKARAAAEPWPLALGSVIIDMQLAGIPLKPDVIRDGTEAATGERGIRDFIGSLTLGSVYRDRGARIMTGTEAAGGPARGNPSQQLPPGWTAVWTLYKFNPVAGIMEPLGTYRTDTRAMGAAQEDSGEGETFGWATDPEHEERTGLRTWLPAPRADLRYEVRETPVTG